MATYQFNPFTGNLDIVGPGGGTTSPAGTNTQIQFNYNGSFGASNDLSWNDESKHFTVNGDVYIPDKIIHLGDTNTAIRFPAADTVSIETAGSERARIDNSGRLLVGTASGLSNLSYETTSNLSPQIQLIGSTASTAHLGIVRTSGGGPSDLTLGWGSDGNVAGSNQDIGALLFSAFDGSVYRNAAYIQCEANGAHAAGDTPGRLVFSTTADGASLPAERMRITSDAYVRLAAGTGGIQFNGDTAAANALDDYEEGAWTPVHSDGTNTATLSGLYRKVGSIVYFRVSASGTGTLKVGSVSGLPFTNIAFIVGVGGKVLQSTGATSDTSFVGYHATFAAINLNLAGDVSVITDNSGWACSFTAVVF
jgi:hypothetical protein